MLKKITQLLNTFGFLRLSLVTLVLIDMLARPMPGTTPDYESPHAVVVMIVSALAPILLNLCLIDLVKSNTVFRNVCTEE